MYDKKINVHAFYCKYLQYMDWFLLIDMNLRFILIVRHFHNCASILMKIGIQVFFNKLDQFSKMQAKS